MFFKRKMLPRDSECVWYNLVNFRDVFSLELFLVLLLYKGKEN